MSATVKIVYVGSLPSVVFEGGFAVRGEPVEVEGSLAERLIQQNVWALFEVPASDEEVQPSGRRSRRRADALAEPESEGN